MHAAEQPFDDMTSADFQATNPRDHFAVSAAALAAGKHVYSEKPLAMDFGDAQRLHAQASDRFYRVDTTLKKVCESLRTIAEPLTTLLGMMK